MPDKQYRFIDVAEDDAHSLRVSRGPAPALTPGCLQIAVAAAGLNRADLLQRAGLYPPPADASPVMGLEVSGEVSAVGEGVEGWAVGDKVMALTHGGGYADTAIVPAGQCLPVPEGVDLVDAAALPEALFTVWHNLWQRAAMQTGESLLVHGGASGIGTTAIPLAKALGHTVYTTAGSAEKCRFCEEMGARKAVNYSSEDFVEVLNALTEGSGIDVILDIAAGDFIQKNMAVAANEGRIITIAFIRGFSAEVNFAPLLIKRLTLGGSSLRSQSFAQKAVIAAELNERVLPLYASGRLKPVIDSRYAFAEVEQAQARMQSGQHSGKILLTL